MSAVRVQSLSMTVVTSGVRVQSLSMTGSVPSPSGSSVRVIRAYMTGTPGFTRAQGGQIWQPATRTWVTAKMRMWDIPTRTWKVVFGSTDPVDPNPPNLSSPVADAGAVPLGTAAYNVDAGSTFVSLLGNDTTGAGTLASPYRTLAKAVSVAPDGPSQITIRGGPPSSPWIYEGEGTSTVGGLGIVIGASKSITIQNYPNEAVIFDGLQTISGWTASGSQWWASYTQALDRSPTFTRGAADGTQPGWQFVNPAFPCASWPDQFWISASKLGQVSSQSAAAGGTFYVEGTQSGQVFTPTKVWIGQDPTGFTVRGSRMTKFLTILGPSSVLRGVTVRRYSPSMCDFGAIVCSAANVALENVILEDMSTNAVSFQGQPGMSATKVTIRRPGNLGVHVNNSDQFTADRADIQFCNNENWNTAPVSGGIKITRSQGPVTVKNSILSNNNCGGVWFDETVDKPYVLGCLAENNSQKAAMMELCSNGVIANCKFDDTDTHGILIQNSDNCRIWNNTVYNTGGTSISSSARIIDIFQDARNANDGVSAGRDTRQPQSYYNQTDKQWKINSFGVANNVLVNPKAGTQSMFGLERLDKTNASNDPTRTFTQYNPTMGGNFYSWVNKPTYPWVAANAAADPNVYQTLAAFQSATGTDTGSTLVTGVNPLNSDGTLNTTYATAANTAALALPSDIAALIGQPAGTKRAGCFW